MTAIYIINSMRKKLLFVVLLLFTASILNANPWVLPKKQSFVNFYLSIDSVNEYYDNNSDKIKLPGNLNILDIVASYSVGIKDDLGLSIEIPYSRWEREFPGDRDVNSGIGDSKVNLKYMIVKKDLYAVSLLGGIKFPGSYKENRINSPGDGNIDVPLGISFGGIYHQFIYDIDFIYRIRSEEPQDEAEIRMDGGIRFNEVFLIKAHYLKVDQFGGKGIDDANFKYQELEEDYDRIGATIEINPSPVWDIFVDYTMTIDGRNTPELDLLTTGVGISF